MASSNQTHAAKVALILFALSMTIFSSSVLARVVSEQEPNNSFAEANEIECGDTVLCASSLPNQGDFFTLVVPGGDSTYFRTFACENDANTFVLLYDSTYNLLALNDDGGPGTYSSLWVFFPQERRCYLQVVDSHNNPPGDYSLSVTCQFVGAGLHDLCSSARQVTFFPYYDESSTYGCGSEAGTAAPDVYYQLTLATPGDLFIQVCSEFFDARVQVLESCVSGFLDDSQTGSCLQGADLPVFGLQAQTYYIMVEGTALNQYGDFSIEILPLLEPCPEPSTLKIFDVGGLPFLDWEGVPEADYYLIEQATNGQGPYEAVATTTETFWQDPIGFSLSRRFYRIRSICE